MADGAAGSSPRDFSASELLARRGEFVALLMDAVDSGASVGFVQPLVAEEFERYWDGVAAELSHGQRRLLACERDGRIVGTVQLALCDKANGRHRAEVQKLLVHGAQRRRGIGAELMREAERAASLERRWLLVLDTREDSAGEHLYRRLGWQAFGRVGDYATDPDGTLSGCVFFTKRIEGAAP
jgi:acetyltransferase